MHIHDTYFIVGHIHYVLFGGSMFAHLRGDLLLVPQDVRPDDERTAGDDPLLPHVHLLQRHVLPDAHHRDARPSAADRRPDDLSLTFSGAGIIGHEPVHDDQRVPAGPDADRSSPTTSSTAWWPGPRPPTIPGTPTRWSGRRRRRRRTTTSSESRRSTTPPYEYSVPGVEDDYLPQTQPRPAIAGPLDPVMA